MNPPPTPPQAPAQRPFPLPVVAFGPGSQPEDETLDYIHLPREISTWDAPLLPEPEAFTQHQDVIAMLRRVRNALAQAAAGGEPVAIDLGGLAPASRELLDQVLGEGEVAIRIDALPGADCAGGLEAQESIYNGVWRVLSPATADEPLRDRIEIGPAPASVLDCARRIGRRDAAWPALTVPPPAGVVNAPAILAEIAEQCDLRRAPADAAHVLNLSLLPLSPEDRSCIGSALGEGRIRILSRGYGNCRIGSCALPQTWRVVYYNHNDTVILDTVEIVDIPLAAVAAREDLVDALERLDETLEWLAGRPGAV
jgi:hydrogenase-1 operon protein HyaF